MPPRPLQIGIRVCEVNENGNSKDSDCRENHPAEAAENAVWREFLAFYDADKTNMDIEDYLEKQVDLIILGFNQPEVTKESLDEYVEVGDIVPLSRQLFQWIQSLTFSKLVKVPNGAAEKV